MSDRWPRFLQPRGVLGGEQGHDERLFTHRRAAFFLAAAALMVPWTIWLFLTLPSRSEAAHWNLAWSGFDTLLIVTFVGCAVRMMHLSPLTSLVAAAAGTLLVTDAWFDIMLADDRMEVLVAAAMGVLVELPMAAICFRTSYKVLRVLDQAKPFLHDAGFRIERGRLVPPADWPPRQRGTADAVEPALHETGVPKSSSAR